MNKWVLEKAIGVAKNTMRKLKHSKIVLVKIFRCFIEFVREFSCNALYWINNIQYTVKIVIKNEVQYFSIIPICDIYRNCNKNLMHLFKHFWMS